MYEYIILALFWIVCSYLTYIVTLRDKKDTVLYNIKGIVLICLLVPLIEENFFRLLLPRYFQNHFINGLLFGALHITNYIYTFDIYIVSYQVIYTSYLGYICSSLNHFEKSVLLHCISNTVVLLSSEILLCLHFRNNQKKQTESEKHMVIKKGKLRKTNSYNDIFNKGYRKYHYIKQSKIPDHIIKMKEIEFDKKFDNPLLNLN